MSPEEIKANPLGALGKLLEESGAEVCICFWCKHQRIAGPCPYCRCMNMPADKRDEWLTAANLAESAHRFSTRELTEWIHRLVAERQKFERYEVVRTWPAEEGKPPRYSIWGLRKEGIRVRLDSLYLRDPLVAEVEGRLAEVQKALDTEREVSAANWRVVEREREKYNREVLGENNEGDPIGGGGGGLRKRLQEQIDRVTKYRDAIRVSHAGDYVTGWQSQGDVPRCPRCASEDGVLGTSAAYFVCRPCGNKCRYWTPGNEHPGDWNAAIKASPWGRKNEIVRSLEHENHRLREDCHKLEMAAADANALVLSHEAKIEKLQAEVARLTDERGKTSMACLSGD